MWSPVLGTVKKCHQYISERGILWALLYGVRHVCLTFVRYAERHLIAIEKRRFLTGTSTISSLKHTIEHNRKKWKNHDWSGLGEEWTLDATKYKGIEPEDWKTTLIDKMMLKYIQKDSIVLEIGPGGGRWTEVLQQMSSRLILVDIIEECLAVCRKRFKECRNIEYFLLKEGGLNFLGEDSVDYVWSYDVFVHINPTDTENYIREFARVLKPGGHAVIHHSGTYESEWNAIQAFRSHVDRRFIAYLVGKYGMTMVEQNEELPHMHGDVISVFKKKDVSNARCKGMLIEE